MNIMQKYVYYMMQGRKCPDFETGVKKLWMINIDAERSEAWKILDKNDGK